MQSDGKKGETWKVILVGDSGVGKTSLYHRFVNNEFMPIIMTIGMDFFTKQVEVNEKRVKLQLWDIVGQSRFRSHTMTYFKNAKIVLLVFDLSNKDSFESIKNYWADEIEKYCSTNKIVAVVGTKYDIKTMDSTEASQFALKNKYYYFETSSKESLNVDEMFLMVAQSAAQISPSNLNAEASITLGPPRPGNSWDGFCRTC